MPHYTSLYYCEKCGYRMDWNEYFYDAEDVVCKKCIKEFKKDYTQFSVRNDSPRQREILALFNKLFSESDVEQKIEFLEKVLKEYEKRNLSIVMRENNAFDNGYMTRRKEEEEERNRSN